MNLLITGYKGFIGQNAVKRFCNHNLSLHEWGDPWPNLDKIDAVLHFGAISSTSETDVEKVFKQNYDFTMDLLEECQERFIKVQFSSSASVYGHGSNFSEDAPVDPRTPYSWSKYMVERSIKNRGYTNVQVFRYFNVYGPHEEHKGSQASPFSQFEIQAKNNGRIKVFEGSENFRRDFIHVDEVLRVQERLLHLDRYDTWNVGTGKTMSFLEVAEQFNVPIDQIPMPDIYKNSYQKYTCADVSKLNKVLAL